MKVQNIPFFDLPVELRQIVYAYIPLSDQVHCTCHQRIIGSRRKQEQLRNHAWNWLDDICKSQYQKAPQPHSLEELLDLETEAQKSRMLDSTNYWHPAPRPRLEWRPRRRLSTEPSYGFDRFDCDLEDTWWFITTLQLNSQVVAEISEHIAKFIPREIVVKRDMMPLADLEWPTHAIFFFFRLCRMSGLWMWSGGARK